MEAKQRIYFGGAYVRGDVVGTFRQFNRRVPRPEESESLKIDHAQEGPYVT